MQLADVILRLLKVDDLVSNALLDEHASRVLRDDRLLVLRRLLVPSLPLSDARLTVKMACSTFSTSPGLTVPSGLPFNPVSLL